MGVANRENVNRLLHSQAVYPLKERLGMSMPQIHGLIARAQHEAANPSLKPYFPLFVCTLR